MHPPKPLLLQPLAPAQRFSSYFSPTPEPPLPSPHHLKSCSELADTHGRVFPQSLSLCPFKVLLGEGVKRSPQMHVSMKTGSTVYIQLG